MGVLRIIFVHRINELCKDTYKLIRFFKFELLKLWSQYSRYVTRIRKQERCRFSEL
jgi:hypothetical protein